MWEPCEICPPLGTLFASALGNLVSSAPHTDDVGGGGPGRAGVGDAQFLHQQERRAKARRGRTLLAKQDFWAQHVRPCGNEFWPLRGASRPPLLPTHIPCPPMSPSSAATLSHAPAGASPLARPKHWGAAALGEASSSCPLQLAAYEWTGHGWSCRRLWCGSARRWGGCSGAVSERRPSSMGDEGPGGLRGAATPPW